ncbi:hypothetical protein ABLN73_12700 [Mycobacterium tuberculosis]
MTGLSSVVVASSGYGVWGTGSRRYGAAHENAKAFHDKCENMTLSDFYWG